MHGFVEKLWRFYQDQDKTTRHDFCTEMQEHCEEDGFSERLIFSSKSIFHISGKVNKQNVPIWGTKNPRVAVKHVRDSPKVNVFCSMSCKKLYGPFFFQEKSLTGASYLNILINWLMPQLHEDNFIFKQDEAPPHWHQEVRNYLDANPAQQATTCHSHVGHHEVPI
jgi:hypothetical protein